VETLTFSAFPGSTENLTFCFYLI